MCSLGKDSGEGRPPARYIIPGTFAIFNSSRMGLALIFLALLVKKRFISIFFPLDGMMYIGGKEYKNVVAKITYVNSKKRVIQEGYRTF